jgi:predicted alpha-1,2-mannosidase
MFGLLWAAGCTATSNTIPPPPPAEHPAPVDQVDPRIGTGGFGFMAGSAFVGALAPRGLVKVGPDTLGEFGAINFLHYSGYWAQDTAIQAFSHLHLHGTGASDYGVLAVMPLTSWTTDFQRLAEHNTPFLKANEHVKAGLYDVTMTDGVRVELTATPRVAHHRITFPANAAAHLMFDLDKTLSGGDVTNADLSTDVTTGAVRGRLRHLGAMTDGFGGYDVWFEARVQPAWAVSRIWKDGVTPEEGTTVTGTRVGLLLSFDPVPAVPVELRVAVSLVSAAGAAANLEAESPTFGFDATYSATRASWAALLDRADVEGGSDAQRARFHTAVYHQFLMPTHVGDANGDYRGLDDQIGQATGWNYVNDLSLWDTYRTVHPLLALLKPEDNRDTARSLYEMHRAGGIWPKWPLATGETGTMLGASAEVVWADTVIKGAPGVADIAQDAYARLKSAAVDVPAPAAGRGARHAVETYTTLGYVPDSYGRSVSETIEYAHNDVALASLARALGHTGDADMLLARSKNWRNLFDPAAGFLRNRNADGSFPSETLDPTRHMDIFAEANAWQSTFGALHDPEGYVLLLGGREAAITKLTEFFTQGRADYEEPRSDPILFSAFPRPYFWPSNQPSIHVPYLFSLLGRPDLTAQWVRWTMDAYFPAQPDGLPGNDDGGTMSAWYVFAALGFYPVAGTDLYVVGTPRFNRVTLQLPDGAFEIVADGVSDDAKYIQSATLNGAPLETPTFHHADLHGGGRLRFVMGTQPSTWGQR